MVTGFVVESATGGRGALRVAVLGPLALTVDGRAVEVPGVKRRAVLALLAMAAPDAASTDRLVDGVWPGEAPASGRAALQSHVSRLRRHLGPHADRLRRTEAGYRLTLADGELDAARFAALLEEARRAAAGDPAAACALLADARRLWRGPPLEDLRDVAPVAAWARALTDARLDASDLLADCALRRGDATAAATAAAEAAAAEPHREASVLLLVRALAAQGRGAEALRVAHDFRRRLVEETGLDASPALAELEAAVAEGAVTIARPPAAPTPAPAPARPRPRPAGPLLGRDAELAGVRRLLATERLVTLVGPGGVGKTRLALEVADRMPPSTTVTFLPLAPVTDPASLPDVLAAALGLESSRGDPLDRAVEHLQRGEHLLVVDNCEHVLDAARDLVDELLARCPSVTILATSRERLAAAGEQASALAPLPMPPDDGGGGEGASDVPSVALFLDRARRARPGLALGGSRLATVCRVVRALDGLPLAVELAAGRLSSLTLDDLEARLDRALDVLADRRRTLRATVEWSYDLLTPDERRLFRALAAFPGGFDLATAEAVGAELGLASDPAAALGHLVDASMVVADLDGRPRYRMLDTLRRFALDRLRAEGELDDAEARLVRWAVALAAELAAANETEAEAAAVDRMFDELANLRTAWRTARERGDLDAATAMLEHLYVFASWRDLTELFRWMLELAADPALPGSRHEALVLGMASEATWFSSGDLDAAEALAHRARDAVRDGDVAGAAMASWAMGDVAVFRGRYREAAEYALAGRQHTMPAEGHAQAALALTYAGDHDGARAHLRRAEEIVGGPTLRAYTRYIAGELANAAGDLQTAVEAYSAAIELAGSVGATFIEGIASVGLVTAQASAGDVRAALAGYASLVDRWERCGAWTQQWTTLRNLADLLHRLGDGATASALRSAAAAAPEAAAVPEPPEPAADHLDRDAVLALARAAIADHLPSPP